MSVGESACSSGLSDSGGIIADDALFSGTESIQGSSSCAPGSDAGGSGPSPGSRGDVTGDSPGPLELSVDLSSASMITNLPSVCLKGIWGKAKQLLNTPGSIVPAPDSLSLARMVSSSSGQRPHFISPLKGGRFKCDSDCANFQAMSICSHTVAVSEVHGTLQTFLAALRKLKKPANFTSLAVHGMPAGRGKKGTRAPRKRKHSVSATAITAHRVHVDATNSSVHVASCQPSANDTRLLTLTQNDAQCSTNPPRDVSPWQNDAWGPSNPPHDVSPWQNDAQGPSNPPCDVYPWVYRDWTPWYSPYRTLQSPSMQVLTAGPPSREQHGSRYSGMPFGTAPSYFRPTMPPMAEDESMFVLCFITGNISKCTGCNNKYDKPPTPPYDICVQHKEWRTFTPTGRTPQSKFAPAYYHVNRPCIVRNWPNFTPQQLVIYLEIFQRLGPAHLDLLATFGYFPPHCHSTECT